MLCKQWALLASALVGLSHALPRSAPPVGHVLHEARALDQQRKWVKRSRIASDAILPVRIAMVHSNLDKAHDVLMELSHPESPKYGQWWSAEDVHNFFAPPTESVNLIKAWIKSVGITDKRILHYENKGWLAVDMTAEEAELLLATAFYEYEHSSDESLNIGTDSYYVPEHIAPLIDYVTPAVKMTSVKKRQTTRILPKRTANGASPHANAKFAPLQQAASIVEGAVSDVGASIKGALPIPDFVPGSGNNAADDVSPAVPGLDPAYQDCQRNMTMPCIRFLYNLPENPQAVDGYSLGVYMIGEYFNQENLDEYYSNYASWVPNGTQPIPALINGAQYNTFKNDSVNPMAEAILDIEFAQALIYPQNITLYQVDDPMQSFAQVAGQDGYPGPAYNTFFDAIDGSYCSYSAYGETGNNPKYDPVYPNPNKTAPGSYQGELMCGTYKPTKVISISFASAESDFAANYQKRVCDEVLRLSLMGTTVVMSSGDAGAASFFFDPFPNGCIGPNHTIWNPQFFTTCPYVLAVGATMVANGKTVLDPETAMGATLDYGLKDAANFSSGGGFSNIFPRPDYQKDAVQYYFDNYDPGYPYYSEFEPDFDSVQGVYNRLGRAFPDVSANGWNLPTFVGNVHGHAVGTSLSAPIFASILTMINQERALVGKGPVGFVHPTFYANPQIFNDITNGTTFDCETNDSNLTATPRWDPTTGLGTPRYPDMLALFLSLP